MGSSRTAGRVGLSLGVAALVFLAGPAAEAAAPQGDAAGPPPASSAGLLPAPPRPAGSLPGPDAPASLSSRAVAGLRSLTSTARSATAEADSRYPAPGLPPRGGRPRPGSIFDPGAAGPGISQSGDQNFLDGALDPRTGWPFVLFDHFRPRPERVERFWIVHTRDCPQEMGTDPWPYLKVLHFDDRGDLIEHDPSDLLAQVAGRVVLVQVQGSLTTPDAALGGMMWTGSWLRRNKALDDGAVVIAFDWPSQRIYKSDPKDINEKGRRAFVAAFHLARFLQAFPVGSRICLLGQSYGGRVVPSALHLLGGGSLNSMDRDPQVRLATARPDLQVRAVIIAGASDHDWLDPGQRLDHALIGCERFLNLYNHRDEALRLYPLLKRSGHRRSLGKLGMTNRDFAELGPLAARYSEHDVDDLLGREHSLLDAVANPEIAHRIAPYLWNDNPAPAPAQPNVEPEGLEERKGSPARHR